MSNYQNTESHKFLVGLSEETIYHNIVKYVEHMLNNPVYNTERCWELGSADPDPWVSTYLNPISGHDTTRVYYLWLLGYYIDRLSYRSDISPERLEEINISLGQKYWEDCGCQDQGFKPLVANWKENQKKIDKINIHLLHGWIIAEDEYSERCELERLAFSK